MAKKATRKLFVFGRYSLALLLPKKWLTELEAKQGQTVALEYDRARGRIVLRFDHQPLPPKTEVSPLIKRRLTRTQRFQPNPNPKFSDLQPIPEM